MDPATRIFERHRHRLLGLAYRVLGSPADAEDVVHDAWLRWHDQDETSILDPEAWLVTATTRLALDRLRRVKGERERYAGPWLPEPLTEVAEAPDSAIERSESLNLSFLALLERLSPEERAAFLLHQVFDYSHGETAAMLQISEEAARQRTHRARQRLREGRPRFTHSPQAQRRLLKRFRDALEQADPTSLRALFAEDAVHVADGGGKVTATLRPLLGRERIARLYEVVARRYRQHTVVHRLHWLNGAPALLTWVDTRLATAVWIETQDGLITRFHALRNPDKLARLATVTNPASGASLG